MSVFGPAGKAIFRNYREALGLRMLRDSMKSAYSKGGSEGGAYGAFTAFNRWSRGYRPGGGSTLRDIIVRKGTVGAIMGVAGAAGGMAWHAATGADRRNRQGR
jgi:hypothetical protein